MKARPSSLAIATTLTMLLLVVASFVAALVVSLVFLPAAVTFAAIAVHLTLATIPEIKIPVRKQLLRRGNALQGLAAEDSAARG